MDRMNDRMVRMTLSPPVQSFILSIQPLILSVL